MSRSGASYAQSPLASAKTSWQSNAAINLNAAAGTLFTLASATGSGILQQLWFAGNKACIDNRLQVFTDGNSTPDIDIDIGTLWLFQNFPLNTQVSTQHLHAEMDPTAFPSTQFAGFLNFPIPYSNGCVVKLLIVDANVSGCTGWAQALFEATSSPPALRLKSRGQPWGSLGGPSVVSQSADFNFFDLALTKPAWLVWAAMCEKVKNNTFTGNTHTSTLIDSVVVTAGAIQDGQPITGAGIPANTTIASHTVNTITLSQAATATATGVALTQAPATTVFGGATMLERIVQITIDGEVTPSIGSSGTEDFFQGSFYFQQRTSQSTPVSAVNVPTTLGGPGGAVNMGLDLLQLCGGVLANSEMKMDLLHLKNAAQASLYDHQMSWLALYYQSV